VHHRPADVIATTQVGHDRSATTLRLVIAQFVRGRSRCGAGTQAATRSGMPDSIARRWFLGLATLLVPLMGFAALLGVAWTGLYRDPDVLVPQLVGQDWVTLVLATPVLALALGRARRGSRLAWIVALGVVGYAAYGYALYAFATRHNELFLVYVAILGASVWALVAGFQAVPRARGGGDLKPRLAWRWIGGFFVGLAILFAAIWLSDIVPALLRRETPANVRDWGTPTNGVHVLDLAFLLPIIAWTGSRLWRRDGGAVVVGGVLLFKVSTLGLAILAMGAMQALDGQRVDAGLVAVFVAMTILSLGATFHYARAVRTQDLRVPA
jgi:hypothetical protein